MRYTACDTDANCSVFYHSNENDFFEILLICFKCHLQNSNNTMLLIKLMSQAFYSFVFIFVICNVGEGTTNTFIEIGDIIGQCNWYTFPMEMRSILPIIIIHVQKPVILQGFGSIAYSRDAFKNVSKMFCH